jgi:hypothetical protein
MMMIDLQLRQFYQGASVMLFHPYEGFGWPIVKPWLQDACHYNK